MNSYLRTTKRTSIAYPDFFLSKSVAFCKGSGYAKLKSSEEK